MDFLQPLGHAAHLAALLAVILLLGRLGRSVARRLRQPEVIGEIVVGLLSGPAVLRLLGQDTFDAVLPGSALEALKYVAKAGLVLFLVGLAHELRVRSGAERHSTLWLAAGSLFAPLFAGTLLAGFVLLQDDPAVRGDAPLPAFVLMVAVTMSITAVPVLARILADRGMSTTSAGRLALAAAVVIDSVGWLLCMLAISLNTGSATGFLHSVLGIGFGAAGALAVRFGVRVAAVGRACALRPRTATVLLGAAALAVAWTVEQLGMTAILGAALVGLAIPSGDDSPWTPVVANLTRAGRTLVPAFFVVTGITVLNQAFSQLSWALLGTTLVLACAGKGVGGYLGARLGGQPRDASRRIAVLMNSRGLTELIVLQAGFSAGILTAPLVLALTLMAVATTAATGPLLGLLDRGASRPEPARTLEPVAVAAEGGTR
ncbi:cation:proton antiporter [Streptomyces cellulosae]|uniref:cation:proton antiporter n=1 Tax=Streptomyces cellulosae TaxID=1968 RepID=UPI0006920D0E|nr:cation:proton antiporter [Streptomyces cellulosae]